MIPPFDQNGLLPPGVHVADWPEIALRFGSSDRRKWLLEGLRQALTMLRDAGCKTAFLDGSFVTDKADPQDYDALWDAIGVRADRLDPILLEFEDKRFKQKLKYRGELFPVNATVDEPGITFLAFFQICKVTGAAKGIVRIELSAFP